MDCGLAMFDFPMEFTETFTVSRPMQVADPYNEDTTAESIESAEPFEVSGFMAAGASAEQGGEPGQERLVTARTLTISDAEADVRRGDRITDSAGRVFIVQGYGARDMNPFTGWRPTLVLHLSETTG